MKLSKPPAAGSAESGVGGDSVVFFLQELWFGRGSVLPCKGDAERGQQAVLTSLMSKGLIFSMTLQV